MKCNQCGTTIPEGSKKCNGCGRKITVFSNVKNINNNSKILETYNKKFQNREQKKEQIENIFEQSKLNVDNVTIQDKNATSAIILSIIGVMFMPFGIIFNIIALTKAKQINNLVEREKTLRTVKILLIVSIVMAFFALIPIILPIILSI